jgi:hypothetical protein
MADDFKTLKQRGNGVMAAPIQMGGGGVEGRRQWFEYCLHGARGGQRGLAVETAQAE